MGDHFRWVIGIYGLWFVGFLVLLWLSINIYDKRYRRKKKSDDVYALRDPNFRPTSEVFIDPKDGKTYRVYYNAVTGEREYIEEP